MKKELTEKDVKKIHKILGVKENEGMCIIIADSGENGVMSAIQGEQKKVVRSLVRATDKILNERDGHICGEMPNLDQLPKNLRDMFGQLVKLERE